MHELSLMEETIAIALNYAHQHHAHKIHRIHMRVGQLSGVVPDALQFAFDVAVKGTMAESAHFSMEMLPVVCDCAMCNQPFEPDDPWVYQCPRCQHYSSAILQGKELEIASLEVS
ncbi:MAG: hydrogenase maturation nickel metallochaperone HypA [Synechococcales cyanobacterium T60_A2020_003]|nr:hydrogenase maturation nickel metallochaperone HypA [Synechococcales cyanobacterium T60_A2020_003]